MVRRAPDAQEIADFAGTGLQPVGQISYVRDDYLNMDKRVAQGWDFGLYYDLDGTPVGDFSLRVNAALLDKFFQSPTPEGNTILNASATGLLRPCLRHRLPHRRHHLHRRQLDRPEQDGRLGRQAGQPAVGGLRRIAPWHGPENCCA